MQLIRFCTNDINLKNEVASEHTNSSGNKQTNTNGSHIKPCSHCANTSNQCKREYYNVLNFFINYTIIII